MKKKWCARVSNVLGTCLSQGKGWRNYMYGPTARKAADHSLALARSLQPHPSVCTLQPWFPVSSLQPTHVLPLPPVPLEKVCPVTSQHPAILSTGSMLSSVPRTPHPTPSREPVAIGCREACPALRECIPVRGDTATHWAVSWDTCWGNTRCPQAQALPAPCQMPLFRWLPTRVYLVGRTWRTLLNITPLWAHPTHWACLILAPLCVWSCRPNLATAASAMPPPCLSPSFAAPQIQPCKGGKFYFTFLKKGSKHPENLKLLLHNPLPPSLLRNPITWTNTFWGFKIDDRIHVILFVPSS